MAKRWLPPCLVALLAVVVACGLRPPWSTGHPRDGAFFAYLSELLARGMLPYRDVFCIHGPLHLLLGAGFVSVLGKTGLVLLGMILAGLMAWTASRLALLGSAGRTEPARAFAAAGVAWGIAAGWPFLADFIVSGGRPKFLAVALVGLAIHAFVQRRAALSGLLCAAAIWTWQPSVMPMFGAWLGVLVGGLFLGRGVKSSLGLTGKTVAFVAIGSAAVVGLLLVAGCLVPFWEQAVLFPLEHPMRRPNPGIWLRLQQILGLLPLPVLVAGGAGILWGGVTVARSRRVDAAAGDGVLVRWACLGWILVYGSYVWFDLDARGDMVPFLIPLGALGGALVGSLGAAPRAGLRLAVAGLLTFWLAGGDLLFPEHHSTWIYRPPEIVSREEVDPIVEAAGGRGVLVFADPLLQHAIGEDPPHPYVFWEHGTINEIWLREEGGLPGFLGRLMDRRYGVVVVGVRAQAVLPTLRKGLMASYRRHPTVTRRDRPVWVLRDAGPTSSATGAPGSSSPGGG